MTQDRIVDMAYQAEKIWMKEYPSPAECANPVPKRFLEIFAELVLSKERDSYAKLAKPLKEPNDPWAGRRAGMACVACIWYVPKDRSGPANSDTHAMKEIGRCRRHAPSMNGFVPVYPSDWCGDHRVDENKI